MGVSEENIILCSKVREDERTGLPKEAVSSAKSLRKRNGGDSHGGGKKDDKKRSRKGLLLVVLNLENQGKSMRLGIPAKKKNP